MIESQTAIGLCSLLVAVASLIWAVSRSSKKRPQVVVTKDGIPATFAHLVTKEGLRFPVSATTACSPIPSCHVGELIIVRHVRSGKELARFTLKPGFNEITL